MSATPFERVRDALAQGGYQPRQAQGGTMARCPAHDDRNPSLSVREAAEGRVLLYCFAGCQTVDVVAALGLSMRDLFADTYDYHDTAGKVVRRVSRTYDTQGRKTFRQTGIVGGPVLYRLPQVVDAVAAEIPVYLVEGEKDADALAAAGCVATSGPQGASNFHLVDCAPLAGAQVVAVVDRDDAGRRWAETVRDKLAQVGASVRFAHARVGKDAADHLAACYGPAELEFWPDEPDEPDVSLVTLADCERTFTQWLGAEYDLDALRAVLAAAAVERLDGDPLWLLLLSGSGNAKTETVQALAGSGATVTSTVSSPGALLSATPQREKAKDATGGLLRKMGARGVLVVKDVTSILSMSRDMRAEVLAALREVYDGRWSRNVGTDGGRTLDWSGRLALVGAVTTAWDSAHDVIASMGDRFVLLRMDSTTGRLVAGRRAIGNTGQETEMRAQLSEAAAGVLAGMAATALDLDDDDREVLLAAADLVTLARTGVSYDYRGNVVDAEAPEMPTRFAKQLAQVVRGGVAIGMDRTHAMRLAIRCARDSMPPLRLAIVDDVAAHPGSTTGEVRRRIGKPRNTVDRQLQALHMLGVLVCDEEEQAWGDREITRWRYSLADGIDPTAIDLQNMSRFGTTRPCTPKEEGEQGQSHSDDTRIPTAISGHVRDLDPEALDTDGRCRIHGCQPLLGCYTCDALEMSRA